MSIPGLSTDQMGLLAVAVAFAAWALAEFVGGLVTTFRRK